MAKNFATQNPLTLGDLLTPLRSGTRVLDLGCGGGTFNYSQFPHLKIHSLDASVHEKAKDFPPNAQFARGVASAIPVRDFTFEVVITNFAFEHFPDAVAALREIDRVTQEGGRVWISIPNAGSFEDQLYRNLFAGGGHLQRPNFEWFLRQVYENTSLKLISYLELPAGFTFLGESEELRHLTWAIVDALRRSVAVDAQSRSGYIFVLQKSSTTGPAFREHHRCCYLCGSPDETKLAADKDESITEPWTCLTCGTRNTYPSSLLMERMDDVTRALRIQWERYPETRPEKLKEMVEERTRWAQELEKQVNAQREHIARLESEFDERGRWAVELDREVKEQREHIAKLQIEMQNLLNSPSLWLKHLWRKLRKGRF